MFTPVELSLHLKAALSRYEGLVTDEKNPIEVNYESEPGWFFMTFNLGYCASSTEITVKGDGFTYPLEATLWEPNVNRESTQLGTFTIKSPEGWKDHLNLIVPEYDLLEFLLARR